MTKVDELRRRHGLVPASDSLPEIRDVLRAETAKEKASQGAGDVEMMKLCCVQLFNAAATEDVLLIWSAKVASMDSDGAIDIQLLCGAGLEKTKKFLAGLSAFEARDALSRLGESEQSGDFEGFSVEDWRDFYTDYYAEEAGTNLTP
jgi:hypothetical protein